MKLPENVVIPQDKLSDYLLKPREKDDKSGFLALAGYAQTHWEILERDLRQFSQAHEVSGIDTSSPYGIKYKVRGTLTGPNGNTLSVVTIWIQLAATGETRFVTLFRDREVTQNEN